MEKTTMLFVIVLALFLLVICAIAGWRDGLIVKGYGFGLMGNIAVGIIGAVISGWLLPKMPILEILFTWFGMYSISVYIGTIAGWVTGLIMKWPNRGIRTEIIGAVIMVGMLGALVTELLLDDPELGRLFNRFGPIGISVIAGFAIAFSGAIVGWVICLIMKGPDRRIGAGIIYAVIAYLAPLLRFLIPLPSGWYEFVPPIISAVTGGGVILSLVVWLATPRPSLR
jgi:uncharacterized membrane protein YeaQ/YmgE (transglycosylase-associated protein family)